MNDDDKNKFSPINAYFCIKKISKKGTCLHRFSKL